MGRSLSDRLTDRFAGALVDIGYAALFAVCLMELAAGGFSLFIYSRF